MGGNLKSTNYGYGDPLQNPLTHYDTGRLSHSVGDNYCGLTIKSPHANDTGTWKCHVNDNNPNGQATTMWADVELFVANVSTAEITRPDLTEAAMPGIEVDLSSGSAEVDAECTAKYGVPPPSLVWYIDEPTNTLDSSLSSERQVADAGLNTMKVTSAVRFTIDEQLLSRYGVSGQNSHFSLLLGCLPDQGNYFTERPDTEKNP